MVGAAAWYRDRDLKYTSLVRDYRFLRCKLGSRGHLVSTAGGNIICEFIAILYSATGTISNHWSRNRLFQFALPKGITQWYASELFI